MAESGENASRYSFVELLEDFQDLLPASRPDLHLELLDRTVLGEAYLTELHTAVNAFYTSNWLPCHTASKMLLDITWEHLNTGHWKDIHLTWRHAYTYISFLKSLSEFALVRTNKGHQVGDCIKTCDMGLLMGAPVLSNILTRIVSRMHVLGTEMFESDQKNKEFISKKETESADQYEPAEKKHKAECLKSEFDLDVLCCPSLERFQAGYMETGTPVVIREAMSYWPAMSDRRWSLSYIKKVAGYRTVPIELGSKYTEENWSQTLMTIGDFIDKYIVATSPETVTGYLAQHELFDQIPELMRDISIPTYCALGECDDVNINAWFGPGGTVSPLHQDPKHNLLAQVMGEKYLKFYSADYTDHVYPHDSHMFSNTSQVDVEYPDRERFPLFEQAPYLECTLRPGDMLYIPPKYWHYVKSLSTSFSVSFWWE